MIFKKSSRIAVLDLTHGGAVIARKLKKISGSVCGVDVYGTLALDFDADTIGKAFLEFKGAQGRMTKKTVDGRILIYNSNSGMDITTAQKALKYAQEDGGRIVMVLGEEAKEVCEGLDPAGVERFIDKHLHELGALVLVGERMKPLVRDANIHYAEDLPGGIEFAGSLTEEKDIILSCVKCFR
jgi:UDP-N-acetylmuramyl pentapeptide synthase